MVSSYLRNQEMKRAHGWGQDRRISGEGHIRSRGKIEEMRGVLYPMRGQGGQEEEEYTEEGLIILRMIEKIHRETFHVY